jgi:hypothetical protein
MKRLCGFFLTGLLAGTAVAADFSGIYSWSGASEDKTSMSQAVVQAASHVPAIIRPIVRKKIVAVVVPYKSIEMAVTNGVITFNRNASDQPITAEIGGKAVKYARTDGKLSDVTFVMDGEKLRQTYSNDEGSRENLFSLSEDGRLLTMEVTIKPKIIKSSISLTLTYVKTDPVITRPP